MIAHQGWLFEEFQPSDPVINPETQAVLRIVDGLEKIVRLDEQSRRWEICGKLGDCWHQLVAGVWPVASEDLKALCEDPRILSVYDAVQAFFRDHDGRLKLAFSLIPQEEFDLEEVDV